jgi:hypothetical protein
MKKEDGFLNGPGKITGGIRRVLPVAALLLLTLLSFYGCSKSAAQNTAQSGSSGAALSAGESNSVINYGISTAWDSLDPYASASGSI